jgi:uncharacterized membrane protein YidH (DUF202 family)
VTSKDPAAPAEPPADARADAGADATLAGERTMLAWTRTTVAFVAIGAAVAKVRPLAGIPIVIFGAGLWLAGRPRRSNGGLADRRARVRAVTAAITTVAVLSLLIVLAGRGSSGFHR